jgi:ribosomal protein S18 acetylase RimI-like enzyme
VEARRGPCRAELGDLEDLVRLESRTFDGELALGRRQFRYLLRCPRASTHVLRRNGKLLAEAVVLRRRTCRGTVARMYSIAVQPECRGQGLGKVLLADCLGVLRGEGVAAVVLEVDVANEPAIRLYERAGFHKIRPLWHYYATGRHAWKMRLDLLPVLSPDAGGATAPAEEPAESPADSAADSPADDQAQLVMQP